MSKSSLVFKWMVQSVSLEINVSRLSVLWTCDVSTVPSVSHLLFHLIVIYNESSGSHPVDRDPFLRGHISDIPHIKITVVKEQWK